jgi:hypothetical protein
MREQDPERPDQRRACAEIRLCQGDRPSGGWTGQQLLRLV